MNFYNFIVGIIIIVIAIAFLLFEFKKYNKLDKNDYVRKSFSVKVIGSFILLIIIGIVTIYRELKYLL